MLLALDVGNTNTVLGLFKPSGVQRQSSRWSPTGESQHRLNRPSDEFGVLLRNLFALAGWRWRW